MINADRKRIIDLTLAMRRNILKMAFESKGNAHFGGGLSIVEILAVLYGAVLKHNPSNPTWPERDRFVLSKGHGVLGFYAVLAECGYFPKNELSTFQANGTRLGAHPVKNLAIGIESSNGSLGQGLSFSVGLALGAKQRKKEHRIFTLLGNGECDEGSVWEAVMAAAQFRLDNLTVIIDNNMQQSDGASERIISLKNIENIFSSFGWIAMTVDGHDVASLYDVLHTSQSKGAPYAIIANTIKGKGVPFMENRAEWHHGRITKSMYDEAVATLGLEESSGQ